VNIILYPINIEKEFGYISIIALFFVIIRIGYTFVVGYRWGKYSVDATLFATFKPLFLYGVIVLIFVLLSQIFFPRISGFLLWPVSSIILVDIDAYVVYLFIITEFLGSNLQGDAAILLFLMLLISGMVIVTPIVVICFSTGLVIFKLIKKWKKIQFKSKKLYSNTEKGKELKYLFLFLAILGTLSLLSFEGQTRILDQPTSLSEPITFIIYESMGLTFLLVIYFRMRGNYSKSKKFQEI
jgi:hypothetical protein